jgi:large-conductance mechanosensitive channel
MSPVTEDRVKVIVTQMLDDKLDAIIKVGDLRHDANVLEFKKVNNTLSEWAGIGKFIKWGVPLSVALLSIIVTLLLFILVHRVPGSSMVTSSDGITVAQYLR